MAAGPGPPGLSDVGPARWDVELEGALREAAQAVYEERVMDRLMEDLAEIRVRG